MLGIILGSAFFDGSFTGKKLIVKTRYGSVTLYKTPRAYYLQRHGTKKVSPHKINYKANITALKKLGLKEIIAVNSCGSLKEHIVPGSFVVSLDYINWFPQTFFEKECVFITPQLSQNVREKILATCRTAGFPAHEEGIYFQTHGPRFETRAEIAMIKNYADLVGMTMGSEAALAQELGMDYASLCTVDNYAHGIGGRLLTVKQIEAMQRKNIKKVREIIKILVSH